MGKLKGRDIQEICRVQGDIEAQLVKDALEDQGIEVVEVREAEHFALPFTVDGLGAVRICVPNAQAAQARDVLEDLTHLPSTKIAFPPDDEEKPDEATPDEEDTESDKT